MRKNEKAKATAAKGVAVKSHIVAGGVRDAAVKESSHRASRPAGKALSQTEIARSRSAIDKRIGEFRSARQLSESDFSVVINAQG
jgi:hypothetical protein